MKTPDHYAGEVTPWDLERCMQSSGDLFVDARRTDAIEYCFRMKDDLLDDLKKARHNLDVAIEQLERNESQKPLTVQRDDHRDAMRYRFLMGRAYYHPNGAPNKPKQYIKVIFQASQPDDLLHQPECDALDIAIDKELANK